MSIEDDPTRGTATDATIDRANEDAEDLVSVERRFWEAAGDAGFYERNMSAEGLLLLPIGLLDRDATLDAVGESEPWSTYEFEDLTVHELGLEGAVVCYGVVASRDGDETPYRALVSTTYRRAGGGWELVVHQQTPLAETD